MRFSTYIFDFDGTLVDSMPYWSEKMLGILRESGVSFPSDIIKIITPLGDIGTAEYFRNRLGVPLSTEEILRQMDAYALPLYRDTIPLKEGVYEYLTRLKAKGCSLNVLTASPHKMLDPCLKRNGVYGLFDNLWSCDDFGLTKSDELIYIKATALLGTSPEKTAFFDDNINAAKTAVKAGMYTVGVFDSSGEEFADELRASANAYINSFSELNNDKENKYEAIC